MNKQFKQVAEFNTLFNQKLNDKPTLLSYKDSALCLSLLKEELKEYEKALSDGNLVEVADALIDLSYVLKGVIIKHGLVDAYEPLFDEVHASNISKACNDVHEANRTVNKYAKAGVATNIIVKNGKFLVMRTVDGKALKSIDYLPARLAPILNEYT